MLRLPTSPAQPNPRALCSLVSIMTAAVNRCHSITQSICRRGRIGTAQHSTAQDPSASSTYSLLSPLRCAAQQTDSQAGQGCNSDSSFFPESFQGQGRAGQTDRAAEPKDRQGFASQPAHTSYGL
jgi:hypothetical protein